MEDSKEEPAAAHDEVIIEGWLTKQGGARGGRKNWKRRYFVLKDDVLHYYKDDANGPLHGLMHLKGAMLLDYSGAQEQQPPLWDQSLVCFECKTGFNLTTRRHHCRNCGRAFCDKCSSKAIPIPKYGFNNPVRVDEACYREITAELSSSRYNISGITDQHPDEDDDQPEVSVNMSSNAPSRLDYDRENSILFSSSPDKGDAFLSPLKTRERGRSKLQKAQKGRFTLPGEMRPHMFALKNRERELWLAADSEKDRSEWTAQITAALTALTNNVNKAREEENKPKEHQWEIDYKDVSMIDRVGGGSFGDVYRGRVWGTDVAVKLLKTESLSQDASVLAEMKQEIEILSNLRHPNVVLYIGACTRLPNICILTEWCERGSLYSVLHDHTIHINAKMIIDLAMGVAQGMNYLHCLEPKIVHRDLKSHNILVDKNFQVKVADFGLSMKTRVKSASGEEPRGTGASLHGTTQNGVYGTPEWMAPEVMEGAAYNEKIDVYSFGILLTELVTRQMPFHDKYQVRSHEDVFDAVLDDGAMPTIPQWCDTFLKPLILQCLDRDASRRPSFNEIILTLRRLATLEDSVYFFQFDIPRLRELVNSQNASVQAMAASEIASLLSNSRIRRASVAFTGAAALPITGDGSDSDKETDDEVTAKVAKMTPLRIRPAEPGHSHYGSISMGGRHTRQQSHFSAGHWTIDDDDAAAFLERFTGLLSSSNEEVQLQACKAIANLLSVGDRQKKSQDRRFILSNGGLVPLLTLLSHSNKEISAEAGRVLLQLTHNLPATEQGVFSGVSVEPLKLFEDIVSNEMTVIEYRAAELAKQLQQRKALHDKLVECREAAESAKKAEADRTAPIRPKMMRARSTKRVGAEFKFTPNSSGANSKPSSPGNQSPETVGDSEIEEEEAAMGQPGPVPTSPRGPGSPTPLSPRGTHTRGPSSGALAALAEVGGVKVSHFVTKFEQKVPSADEQAVRNMLLKVIPTDVSLPLSFRNMYPFCKYHGYALRYDEDEKEWHPCYLLLGQSELRVFNSHEDEPGDPNYVIRVRTPQGQPAKVRTGAMFERPFVFSMEDCGYAFYFCARTETSMTEWAGFISETISRPNSDPDLAQILPPPSNSDWESRFPGPVEYAGYMLLKNEDGALHHSASPWRCRFFVQSRGEVRFFASLNADMSAPEGIISLKNSDSETVEIRTAPDDKFPVFVVSNVTPTQPNFVLCARSFAERDEWVKQFVTPSDASTPHKAVDPQTPRSLKRDGIHLDSSPPVTPRMGLRSALTADTDADVLFKACPRETWCANFLQFYPQLECHGYLQRKRKYSGRWAREYFILVGTAIHSFKNHLSAPDRPQATLYTCTGSGRPFPYQQEFGISEKRKFVFSLKNPDASWVLACETDEDLHNWLGGIRMSIQPSISLARAQTTSGHLAGHLSPRSTLGVSSPGLARPGSYTSLVTVGLPDAGKGALSPSSSNKGALGISSKDRASVVTKSPMSTSAIASPPPNNRQTSFLARFSAGRRSSVDANGDPIKSPASNNQQPPAPAASKPPPPPGPAPASAQHSPRSPFSTSAPADPSPLGGQSAFKNPSPNAGLGLLGKIPTPALHRTTASNPGIPTPKVVSGKPVFSLPVAAIHASNERAVHHHPGGSDGSLGRTTISLGHDAAGSTDASSSDVSPSLRSINGPDSTR